MSLYFDFHFHPVFKQYITKFETDYPTGRLPDDLIKDMDLKNDLLDFVDENVLHILESQCCINQMKKGGLNLGVANVVAIELGIAASEGFIAKLLRSNITRPMDPQYFNNIRRGSLSYYRLFLKELDLFRKVNGSYLHFLSRKKDRAVDEGKCSMVLGMEGAHNLSRKKIGTDIPDQIGHIPNGDAAYNDFFKNPGADAVTSLKNLQQALWDDGFDLFYVTLTHLSHIAEQPLATHAFGMKMLKHDAFYPVGNGITPLGKSVIDAAYKMEVNDGGRKKAAPIFIDVKHMGLKSRLDFYEHRRKNNYKIPILATHMGVTGYAIEDWKQALKKTALLKKANVQAVEVLTERKKAGEWGFINKTFTFNPWSINLMDEDIIEIIESDGLIGVSLDVRVLGFQALIGVSSKDQAEYLSSEEFRVLFPNVKVSGLATEDVEEAEALESWLKPTKEERHPLCLCFNILHIVSTAMVSTEKDPWKHICIGSDFDGLIDPVKICRDASKMPDLEKNLIRWLPVAEKAYREQNGGPRLMPRTSSGDVDLQKLKKLVRGIMYENGKNFINDWLGQGGSPSPVAPNVAVEFTPPAPPKGLPSPEVNLDSNLPLKGIEPVIKNKKIKRPAGKRRK